MHGADILMDEMDGKQRDEENMECVKWKVLWRKIEYGVGDRGW